MKKIESMDCGEIFVVDEGELGVSIRSKDSNHEAAIFFNKKGAEILREWLNKREELNKGEE